MTGQTATPVRVEVLGPLRLVVDGADVEVRGPKRRAVLALLALAEGRTVPIGSLVDALWPAEAPESGRQALHSHVFRLRGHLGPAAERLETGHEGYRLVLRDGDLDLARARALLAAARAAEGRDPASALTLLQEAHALWHGPVLPDLTDVEPVAVAAEACRRLHGEVTDALVAAAIAAGRAGEVLGLAGESLADDPLREPAVLLLMRALAACGQAPEALRAGREYRRRLAEETGLDPSPALADVERDIAGGVAAPARPRPPAHPRPTTPLIGREDSVAALRRLLGAERLVTVVGPGGVGKTRLALEVAARAGTATVLPLAAVSDAAAVPHALAAALDLAVVQGDVLGACLAVLGDRPGLLVVDNCEHLLDSVRDTVATVLASCPRLSVLATSRERLGLAAEYAFRLPALPLPDSEPDLAAVPSVALFLDRARRVRAGPPPSPAELRTVAEVVRRLDGMPLAIELAAGRLSTFSLTDLRDRLDRSLDLLGGSGPSGDPRHRTLRATAEWSYQLLPDDEKRLFRHLAVFVDGADLDAAERLAAGLHPDGDPGSVLAHLVDASVLDVDFTAGTRYRMPEALRAFGLDRLAAAGEEDQAADALLGWAVDLSGWIRDTLDSADEPRADAVLRRELANLREAWRTARTRGRLDAAVGIVAALFDAIAYRDLVELRGWALELAADPELRGHPREAAVLGTAGESAYHRGDRAAAERLARAGLRIGAHERSAEAPGAEEPGAEESGAGGSGAGGSGVEDHGTDAHDRGVWACRSTLSVVALARGAYTEAVEHALAAAAAAGTGRENLGLAALATAYAGDLAHARSLVDRGRVGAVSHSMRAWGDYVAGEIDSLAGRHDEAERHYRSAVDLARAAGATFLVGVATVGRLAERARAGRVAEALRGYREVIDYFDRTGNWTHQWVALRNLADLLRRIGDDGPAAAIDDAADRAPDAPADDRPRAGAPPDTPLPGRAAVLELARRVIDGHLARS
ncbi:winged helix-turn-helix domain-containing protein [Geodermatophilus sp. YIM 151500]|uniref:ATP-binding protein n=1 Tax=Geodermatophilus sp. YIM 151500 TaxID=2984531 RepID=UPI0021E4660E|nr:BTAD domain-containing putative transcriptional regulator [Geodermatophilus sp. YIM 151500]MCV2488682.1 winged helix-turn-helix domain-containing protein [Geodermatophilus sp. YIM 151500]